MAEIAQTTDPWGRPIVLTEERWSHIIFRHEELSERQLDILAALERPDRVMRDAGHGPRENYYQIIADPQADKPLYMKVCVEFDTSGGTIITAFMHRGIPRGEQQLWP
jgi:hypothetical protein